jgi:hypothetical protein
MPAILSVARRKAAPCKLLHELITRLVQLALLVDEELDFRVVQLNADVVFI